MTDLRPACPCCGLPVDRLRRSLGIVAAYPCNDWLTPTQAADVQAESRALRAAREA
jgi:hypothetical protein